MKFKLKHWQIIAGFLIVYDFITVVLSYFLALWIRFDATISCIPSEYALWYKQSILFYALITVIVYSFLGLYKSMWRFASFFELKNIIIANAITLVINVAGISLILGRMPISYYIIGAGFQGIFCLGIRFSYRFISLLRDNKARSTVVKRRVLLIGAGSAGRMILRDINFVKNQEAQVCCIIDDNPNKWGRQIDGVDVVGNTDKILSVVEEYKIDEIFIAIAALSPSRKRDIINICKETNCVIKQLPNMYAEKAGIITATNLQNITIEDVLGRDAIKLDKEDVEKQIAGKVVLVTGGGGSIGAELCRQIASYGPKQLIIFDIYENNAYDIQLELKKKYPNLLLETLIGSVRDSKRIESVFERYRPDIVYHAAAHKHVPLMQDSPCEAIKNNVIGTYKTAYAAVKFGCGRFVLISTDKAVNPTNIMGASKRLCELVIQTFDKLLKENKADRIPELYTHVDADLSGAVREMVKLNQTEDETNCDNIIPHTEFVAVRFGNVLGSNGSVVPLFKRQIAEGGPVTVTHPDIIRYFMTIPEAVSLVLKSGCNASGGEIFVLDMGEPVKIVDLAKNMIELAGYKAGVDIEIEFCGLRPGEKLYEEKLMAEEGLKKTENELIHVAQPMEIDAEKLISQLIELMNVAYDNKQDEIFPLVRAAVPTFKG